jgi:hypothetical protein
MKIEEVASRLRELADLKKELTATVKSIDLEQAELLAVVKEDMDKNGVPYLKTKYGSLSISRTKKAKAIDKFAFLEYLRGSGNWEAADIRPVASALDPDSPPPGVVIMYDEDIRFTATKGEV